MRCWRCPRSRSNRANIEALCAAGADVIVDDIGYLREAPFQDDIVAQGINAAVAAGRANRHEADPLDGFAGVLEYSLRGVERELRGLRADLVDNLDVLGADLDALGTDIEGRVDM